MVTTNSATLVNKGLEVIEAHLLFGMPFDRIDVVGAPAVDRPLDGRVHRRLDARPVLARRTCGCPIALGTRLARPGAGRAPRRCDWTQTGDVGRSSRSTTRRSPRCALARQVGALGGTHPAVYNAANEECVDAFLAGRIRFLAIVDTVARVVAEHDGPRAGGRLR